MGFLLWLMGGFDAFEPLRSFLIASQSEGALSALAVRVALEVDNNAAPKLAWTVNAVFVKQMANNTLRVIQHRPTCFDNRRTTKKQIKESECNKTCLCARA